MCAYHEPVQRNTKKLNKGCTEDFCRLGLATLRIVGGSPTPGTDCLKVADVEVVGGDTIVTAEWGPCCP
jgi:hypothetical protein